MTPFWSTPADWPERYAVRLLAGEDLRTVEYHVTSTLGERKAMALAAALHVRRHGDHVAIHDVDVEPLGPVGTDERGRPERVPGDLHDFLEGGQ